MSKLCSLVGLKVFDDGRVGAGRFGFGLRFFRRNAAGAQPSFGIPPPSKGAKKHNADDVP